MIQQRVDQGAVRVARAGMHHDAWRLVDCQDGLILEDNVDGNVLFGPVFIMIVQACAYPDGLPAMDGILLLQSGAVNGDETVPDPCLQACAGMARA